MLDIRFDLFFLMGFWIHKLWKFDSIINWKIFELDNFFIWKCVNFIKVTKAELWKILYLRSIRNSNDRNLNFSQSWKVTLRKLF